MEAEGRLIGGRIETLCNRVATPYLDISAFDRNQSPRGLLVYVQAAEHDALTICRNLLGMRHLAGFFEHAIAILVGRASTSNNISLSQH